MSLIISAGRQNKNENPYAEPAIPAPPLVESSPSDIPQFEDQPYADVHPPVRRDRSNQLGEDHMHDDEDDIPNFGMIFHSNIYNFLYRSEGLCALWITHRAHIAYLSK